jgi:hypothetical protein
MQKVDSKMSFRPTTGVAVSILLTYFGMCGVARAAEPTEFDILTVKDAARVEHHDLRGINARQINYTIQLDYPNVAIGQDQYEQLGKRGWVECTGKRKQWEYYVDSVDPKNPYCEYKTGKYLIKNNSLMLISLLYHARPSTNLNCPSRPDNSTQVVVAVIYEHSNRESMQLDKLGLSCGK